MSTFDCSLSTMTFFVGASTNGKSGDFGSPIWRFESSRPSQSRTETKMEISDRGTDENMNMNESLRAVVSEISF
jgi:hypothetical protein